MKDKSESDSDAKNTSSLKKEHNKEQGYRRRSISSAVWGSVHSKQTLTVVLLAFAVIALIVFLKWQKSAVRRNPPQPKPAIDYRDLITVHADQAYRRNLNALRAFEMNVERILGEYEDKVESAGRQAAEEGADYGSCCKIVYYLAWDKVKGDNEIGRAHL